MDDYQPLCDASEEARKHLAPLRDMLHDRGLDVQLTKDLMTGPWLVRVRFPGVRLPEEVVCGEIGGWRFFTWRRGDLVAPVADIEQVAESVARTPWEDDVTRQCRTPTKP